MITVEVQAKIVVDESGIQSEIPVLLTLDGVLSPLLDYFLNNECGRGVSWQRMVLSAARLLIEYMSVSEEFFDDPKSLFQTFASRLYTGTIGDDGMDPSGLYWSPLGSAAASRHISALKGLTDYLANNLGAAHINPLVIASTQDQRLIYAAWHRRTHNDFLGHISKKAAGSTAITARNVRGARRLSRVDDDSVAFPESIFERFYLDGFGSAKDRRCAVRDQLILILLHGAGKRESEALHLWVPDVLIDPSKEGSCTVRIYHPEDGVAPDGWKSRTGKRNRSAYLKEKYALTSRTRLSGTKRVGWKGKVVDHPDNYIQLHWFPSQFGVLFLKLWREHLLYLMTVERNHPYAFVSYEKKYAGQPYKLSAFNENYANALARIGYSTSKVEGRSPHGHRHAFGRRLTRAGVDPIVRKKALHHSTLTAQVRYTSLNIVDVSKAMQKAEQHLMDPSNTVQASQSFKDWEGILQAGFDDVDPQSFMSGTYPKLRSF